MILLYDSSRAAATISASIPIKKTQPEKYPAPKKRLSASIIFATLFGASI